MNTRSSPQENPVLVSVILPRIVEARDYHDFQFMASFLHQLDLQHLAVEEIGFVRPEYLGLVYDTRHPPSAEDIKELCGDGEFDRLSWQGLSLLDDKGQIKR